MLQIPIYRTETNVDSRGPPRVSDEAAVKRLPDCCDWRTRIHDHRWCWRLSYPEENAHLPNFPDLPPELLT